MSRPHHVPNPRRKLHLGHMYITSGTHIAGWRLPEVPHDAPFDLQHHLRAARIAEAGKLDFFFLGDTLPGDIVGEHRSRVDNSARLEPYTLLSAIAAHTERIGLVVTAHPTYHDPYILARQTASLDHISSGRLAWNVVLGASDIAARNFSRKDLGGATRYRRADEFLELVHRLWDSVEDGAYVQDKATGQWLDPERVHRIGWEGEFFQVEGTLPLSRSPQGAVPLLYAGSSELSRDLSAKHIDIHFNDARTIEEGIAFATDIRGRAAALGRDPDRIAFLPGAGFLIGDTRRAAIAEYDALNAFVLLDDDPIHGGRSAEHWASPEVRDKAHPPGALAHGWRSIAGLSARLGVAPLGTDLDAVVRREQADGFNAYGRELLVRLAQRTDRTVEGGIPATVRDLLHTAIVDWFPLIIGTAEQAADHIEAWFESGASDGFNANSPTVFEQLERFTGEVVPILQRRGLFRTEYEASTFRGLFDLPVPANAYRSELAATG